MGALRSAAPGTAPELPRPPLQFGDYAAWEAGRPPSALEPGLTYWRDQLAGLPALDLAAAGQRPAGPNFAGATHEFELDPELAAAVAGFARRHGVTVYMTLLAAFQALLARQSGQDDFAVGSPVAGRPYRELEQTVGSFVNMLAIRARLGDDPTFAGLVARCRSTVLDGLSHQDVPFDHVVRDQQAQRDASRSPLFQVTFTLTSEADGTGPAAPAGLRIGEFPIPRSVTQFELALYATEQPQGSIGCCFTYRTDLFTPDDIRQLGARLTTLLHAAVRQPDLRLSQLPAMTAAERDLVLTRWAAGPAAAHEPGTLHALFETQAARTPQVPALVLDGQALTYAELDSRANQLAHRLRRLGVGTDVRVAICLPPSLDVAVAILAVLKAGGAYLPLDPSQPSERREYLVQDARARVLLTEQWHPDGYPGDVIDLATEAAALRAESGEPVPAAPVAGLAYVIYTSGTTGQPKGVAVGHAAIVSYLLPGVRTLVLDRYLQPTAPGVPGELYLGGSRLARGYLHKPGFTAERFSADPFGQAGARLYRTGDRARWLPDGTLEFLGRNDHQVKIRGYRVELGEIEAALARLPEVAQAVVDLRGTPGNEFLAAYLTPAEARGQPTPAELKAALSSWLPEYMIPTRFAWLDAFPRQAHGKVDRSLLPDPGTEPADAAGYQAPRDEIEQRIAGTWAEILELTAAPGVHDNFFELGGHSLHATRVVARLRKEFRDLAKPISIMDMFASPSVAELAELVRQAHVPDGPAAPRLIYELTAPVPPGTRTLSIVCAPYGGASASVYQELAAALPAGHSLYAIQVPGREVGVPGEHLPVEELAEACAAEILRDVPGRLVVYGHCGPGGALAVALAQRLAAAGREPEALYLGGVFPFARPTGRLLGPLTRLVQMDRLRADRNDANWLRGMGVELSDLDTDAVQAMVRAMRRDGTLAEAYFTELLARGARKLTVPVISVVGERDPASEYYEERYTEWGFLSDRTAVVVVREAGHFFVRHRAAELAAIVTGTHPALTAGRSGTLAKASRGQDPTWWLHESRAAGTEPAAAPAREQGMNRFAAIASSQLVSIVGSTLTEFAIPLWMYLRTGSLSYFGLLAVIALLPGIVMAPVAGAITDRYDRRRVMIAGDMAAFGVEAILLILAWAGALQLWNISLLTGLISVALIFQRTAYLSAIPQIVPKRFLGHANGIFQAANGFAQFAGPLIGVGLLAAVGLRSILALDVASYLVAIGAILLIRFPAAMAAQRAEPLLAEIRQGLRYILGRPGFRALLLFFAVLNLCVAPAVVLEAPLVLAVSSLPLVAVIAAAGGIGAAAGGLAMSVWGGPQSQRMRGIRVLVPVLAFFIAITGFRPSLLLVGIGMFGINACLGLINGIVMTIVQTKVPQRLQGRFIALSVLIASLTLPFAFGVVAPYGPPILRPLTSAHGTAGDIVRAVTGSGHGRPIGLVYLVCAVALALVAVGMSGSRRLARFDLEVADATPDDLLGIQAINDARAGDPGAPARRTETVS